MSNIFDTDLPHPGQRMTESAHRKIELQSPDDLTFLIANVARAAREKLDRHLPPDAAPDGEEDAMRMRVEQILDEFIRQTFQAAKDSISINGLGSREMELELAKAQAGEEMEPFDARLAQRIQNLSTQIENKTLELANLRRTAPRETSQRFRDAFEKQIAEQDDLLWREERDKVEDARATKLDVGEMERLDEVQQTWQQGTDGLMALKSGLGNTVAKMERAQVTIKVVEGK